MHHIDKSDLDKILERIQGGAEDERRIREAVKAGTKESHQLGETSADYRMGFADGLDQAVFIFRELIACA